MSDPTRLLQDAPSDLEAELLRSVASERPTFEHRTRVRQAMGLAPGGSIAPPAGAGSLGAGKMAIAGLIAAGAIAALLARGASHYGAGASTGMVDVTAVAPSPPAEPAIAIEPAAPVVDPQSLPSAGAPPSPNPRATAIPPSRPTRESKSTADATPSDIRAQIALIDEAHAALKRHAPGDALRAVDLYSSRYPGGLLDQEAAVIRIEAVDQSGNHARAASLARAFLAKHPASAHAKRLEGIAGN